MNKQPFYHRMEVLFTATGDLSDEMNHSPTFKASLTRFLKETLGNSVVRSSVMFDGPVTAEPGDPADLVGASTQRRR
jgi:hypothetical protein